MYLLVKDHKSWSEESGKVIPSRPVLSGNTCINMHLSELVSDLIEPISMSLCSAEIRSTEEAIEKFVGLNEAIITDYNWKEKSVLGDIAGPLLNMGPTSASPDRATSSQNGHQDQSASSDNGHQGLNMAGDLYELNKNLHGQDSFDELTNYYVTDPAGIEGNNEATLEEENYVDLERKWVNFRTILYVNLNDWMLVISLQNTTLRMYQMRD